MNFTRGGRHFWYAKFLPNAKCTHLTLNSDTWKYTALLKRHPEWDVEKSSVKVVGGFGRLTNFTFCSFCKTLQNVKSQISRISGSVSDERHPRRASREWPVFFANLKKLDLYTLNASRTERFFAKRPASKVSSGLVQKCGKCERTAPTRLPRGKVSQGSGQIRGTKPTAR